MRRAPGHRQPIRETALDIADAHAAVSAGTTGEEDQLSENVLGSARIADGDAATALAASHVVVSGRFHTPWIYQGYLETQTATAWLDPEGELVISASTQAPFATRDGIAELFGLPAPLSGSAPRRWAADSAAS